MDSSSLGSPVTNGSSPLLMAGVGTDNGPTTLLCGPRHHSSCPFWVDCGGIAMRDEAAHDFVCVCRRRGWCTTTTSKLIWYCRPFSGVIRSVCPSPSIHPSIHPSIYRGRDAGPIVRVLWARGGRSVCTKQQKQHQCCAVVFGVGGPGSREDTMMESDSGLIN